MVNWLNVSEEGKAEKQVALPHLTVAGGLKSVKPVSKKCLRLLYMKIKYKKRIKLVFFSLKMYSVNVEKLSSSSRGAKRYVRMINSHVQFVMLR